MPQIGEIRSSVLIGRESGRRYLWHACIDCGKERWIQMRHGKPISERCRSCAAKLRLSIRPQPESSNSRLWKGGRYRDLEGYIRVFVAHDERGGYSALGLRCYM